jgi:hypothetical protein
MAKPARKPTPSRRLKVYAARLDGLNDYVVAAPNQGEALKAWDVRQNLFQEGLAAVTDEASAVKAASARPGVVLRRPAKGKGGWVEV